MKNRTINWVEGKIIQVLSKNPTIQTYLALSANVLEDVRSIEEQHNLDIAVVNLLSRKIIKRYKSNSGHTTYSLAA